MYFRVTAPSDTERFVSDYDIANKLRTTEELKLKQNGKRWKKKVRSCHKMNSGSLRLEKLLEMEKLKVGRTEQMFWMRLLSSTFTSNGAPVSLFTILLYLK